MRFDNNEFVITDDTITINKDTLEAWRNHYRKIAAEEFESDNDSWKQWFYSGKADVLIDILKHFEDGEEWI